MDVEGFSSWLERYAHAWTEGDAEGVVELFAPAGHYHETPFAEPLVGHAAIGGYWAEGARQTHRDVQFDYDVLGVAGRAGVAHWHARFTRTPSETREELDGVLVAELDAHGLCTEFREWWHRRETPAA